MEQRVRDLVEKGPFLEQKEEDRIPINDSFLTHLKSRMHRDLKEGSLINIANFLYEKTDISINKEFIEMFPSLLRPLSMIYLSNSVLNDDLLIYFISQSSLTSPLLSPSSLRRHLLFLMRNHPNSPSIKYWSSFFSSLHCLPIYESYNLAVESLIEFGCPYLTGIFELFSLWKERDPSLDCSPIIRMLSLYFDDDESSDAVPFHIIGLIASSTFCRKEKMAFLQSFHKFDKWGYLVLIEQLGIKVCKSHLLVDAVEDSGDLVTSAYVMYLITFRDRKCTFPYRGNEEAYSFCLKAQIERGGDLEKLLDLVELGNKKISLLTDTISFLGPRLGKLSFSLFDRIITALLKFKEKVVFDFMLELLKRPSNLKYLLPKIADSMNYHYFPLLKEFLPILARRCSLSFALVIRFMVENGRKTVLDHAFPLITLFLKNHHVPSCSLESESVCLIIDSIAVLVKGLYLRGDLAVKLLKDLPKTPPITRRIIHLYRFYHSKELMDWKDEYPSEVLDSLLYYPYEDWKEVLYELYTNPIITTVNPSSMANAISNEISLMPRSMMVGLGGSAKMPMTTTTTSSSTPLTLNEKHKPIQSIYEAIAIFKKETPPLLPLNILVNLPSLTLVPWLVKLVFLQHLFTYSKLYVHIDYSSVIDDYFISHLPKTTTSLKASQQFFLVVILSLFRKNFNTKNSNADEILLSIKERNPQSNDEIQSSIIISSHLLLEKLAFSGDIKQFSFSWILASLFFPSSAEDHWCKKVLFGFNAGFNDIFTDGLGGENLLEENLLKEVPLKEPHALQGIASYLKGKTETSSAEIPLLLEEIKGKGPSSKKVDIFYRIAGYLSVGSVGSVELNVHRCFMMEIMHEITDLKLNNLFSLLIKEKNELRNKEKETRFGPFSLLSVVLEREEWNVLALVSKLPLNLSIEGKPVPLSLCLKHFKVSLWGNEHHRLLLLKKALSLMKDKYKKDSVIDLSVWRALSEDLLKLHLIEDYEEFQNIIFSTSSVEIFEWISLEKFTPFKLYIPNPGRNESPPLYWKCLLKVITSPADAWTDIKHILSLRNIAERIEFAIEKNIPLTIFSEEELLSNSNNNNTSVAAAAISSSIAKHFNLPVSFIKMMCSETQILKLS